MTELIRNIEFLENCHDDTIALQMMELTIQVLGNSVQSMSAMIDFSISDSLSMMDKLNLVCARFIDEGSQFSSQFSLFSTQIGIWMERL